MMERSKTILWLVVAFFCSSTSGDDGEALAMAARKQQIKRLILEQLKLDQLPSVSNFNKVPAEIEEEYDILVAADKQQFTKPTDYSRDESSQNHVRTLTSFKGSIRETLLKGDWIPGRGFFQRHYRLSFNFQVLFDHFITAIQLILYQKPVENFKWLESNQTVKVVKLIPSGKKHIRIPLAVKTLSTGSFGFKVFELTVDKGSWLKDCIQNTSGYIELEVSIYSSRTEKGDEIPPSLVFETDPVNISTIPRLVFMNEAISTAQIDTQRSKRLTVDQIGNTRFCSNLSTSCCLRNMTLDFHQDLGFEFVKKPRTINFGYCKGLCPLSYGRFLETPQVYLYTNKKNKTITPCCTAGGYADLHLLLYEPIDGKYLYTLENTIALNCKCK